MTTENLLRQLMNGATIEKGSFAGYWLRPREGKRTRITPEQARELIPRCTRIDDHTSRVGETWAFCDCQAFPTHISNGCLVHNDNPTFYE